VLREQAAGAVVAEFCRKHGMSSATLYAWKAIYGPPTVRRGFDVMVAMVCINLSCLRVERSMLLAMMGSARPRPV
jgi:hypothetical protein